MSATTPSHLFYPGFNTTWAVNTSDNETLLGTSFPVADQPIHKEVRVLVLCVITILGIIGGALVFTWIWANRRRNSRVNILILNLALSDIMVIFLSVFPQIIWEYVERRWDAGDFMCRLVKFLQTFAITSSNYMLVVLAVDRHIAIRSPLRDPPAVWKMTACGWGISAFLCLPNMFLFRLKIQNGMPMCRSYFDVLDITYRQAYLTIATIMVFLVPFVVICICYARIFLKIAQKANESNRSKKSSIKPGKVHLQSTPSSSLPKAKIKTLKMTIIIVMSYIICGAPYFVCEMWMSFGDHTKLDKFTYAIIGAMAVANSATNPYVFLLFNVNIACLSAFRKKDLRSINRSQVSTRSENYTTVSRCDSRRSQQTDLETTEISMLNVSKHNDIAESYEMKQCEKG